MFEYIGNIHIHSTYSDGSGTIEEIAASAISAGLDFIIVTDHFSLQALPEEGYREKLLLLVGMEINDDHNHYLALDIRKAVANNTDQPQTVIDSVNQQGGIGIIAHPVEYPSPFLNNGAVYNWNDWSVQGFQGIEIWNLLSQWKGSITSLIKACYYCLHPHPAIIGPYPEIMKKFDYYQQQGQRVVAFGGSDAHAPEIKLGPFKIPIISYQLSFRCINMHVLLNQELNGDPAGDKDLIYHALRLGSCWVAYDYYKDSRGFAFELCKDNQKWSMGETVSWQNSMSIKVSTPYYAQVKLIKNGLVSEVSKGTNHVFRKINPGIYRVEVYHRRGLKLRPWIFSNSIWIS